MMPAGIPPPKEPIQRMHEEVLKRKVSIMILLGKTGNFFVTEVLSFLPPSSNSIVFIDIY
jgi:hypothetical protein